MSEEKFVFILTHPIQYLSPLFAYFDKRHQLDCEVWYLSGHGLNSEYDRQFGVNIKWDIPLLDGYKYEFIKNNSLKPGIYNGLFGLVNFGLLRKMKLLPAGSIIVIQGWNYFSYVFAIVVGKILGHKICLRVESPLKHELSKNRIKLFIKRILLKHFLFRFVYKFLYIGEQNRLFYLYYGAKKSDLISVPYAVNNAYFKEKANILKAERINLLREFKIPLNHKVILYSGKLIEKKYPIDLLKAFKKLPDDIKAFLIFMGDGPLRTKIEKELDKNDFEKVLITGFVNQSNVSKYYAIADIYVMCSGYGETWGLSINEAMNFGIPIMVSDLTGSGDDLVDGNGMIFRTNDVEDLTNKLVNILRKPEDDLKKMGRRSIEIINAYSFDAIEKGLCAI